MKNVITKALFATQALRVCREDQPFWYTSGLFGPYYINTHFLFGSEAEAKDLLEKIEYWAEDERRTEFTSKVAGLCARQYESSSVYRSVIDAACAALKKLDCDFVSGGERRDFFFSLEVARQLKKPHLSLFKDGSAWLSDHVFEKGRRRGSLASDTESNLGKGLHIADLITEASSYTRSWIGSVADSGGQMTDTLAIVDRCQGGTKILQDRGIHTLTLAEISPVLFHDAREQGLINAAQETLLLRYYEDPHAFVKDFIATHPDFLEQQEALDAKTAERVVRLRAMQL